MKTMRIAAFVTLCTLVCACGAKPAQRGVAQSGPEPRVDVRANDPRVRITGRSDQQNEAAPRFSYPGVEVELAFEAEAVSVRLHDRGSRFEMALDGRPWHELALSHDQELHELAPRLAPGPHRVALRRVSPSPAGSTEFLGFVLHGKNARVLDLPARPERRLELVGDEIGCDGQGFGALAAQAVGAELHTECVPGIGVSRDASGKAEQQMPDLFLRTLPDAAEPGWDFARYVPDAVIVNLGGNDFGQGLPDDVSFIAAYEGFVAELRELYPRAHLVCTTGPVTSDEKPPGAGRRTKLDAWVSGVVERRNLGGDTDVSYLAFRADPKATQEELSAALVAHLKKELAW